MLEPGIINNEFQKIITSILDTWNNDRGVANGTFCEDAVRLRMREGRNGDARSSFHKGEGKNKNALIARRPFQEGIERTMPNDSTKDEDLGAKAM